MLFKMITHLFSSTGLPEGPWRVHGRRTKLGLDSTEPTEAGHRALRPLHCGVPWGATASLHEPQEGPTRSPLGARPVLGSREESGASSLVPAWGD